MKVTFLGATHEVTGSCTLLETNGKYILIDCGMEQGGDTFENQQIPVVPSLIDCVLLTHAHIDHSGNLPLLYKNGFRGKIYATEATVNLCEIMLRDCAHIQEFEAEWKNRKAKRAKREEVEPIYDLNDTEGVLENFIPCNYKEKFPILENVDVRFNDIGHLLGSAAIEIFITENDVTKKIVFSGDVGNINQPIICDPGTIDETDYLVIESTYGDKYHPDNPDYIKALTECIEETFDRGGNVVIPSFAVGRTQELLYFIRYIKENNLIKKYPHFPVYVDSPLSNEATDIFMQCDPEYFDDETKAILNRGVNPLFFDDLKISVTSDESKLINFIDEPKVIISASGMCEAGRIRHHLKHNLWRKECTILFVGYQAEGTLGRIILDGAEKVKLFGEEIYINAEIRFLEGISGHADKAGLLRFIEGFKTKPQKIFVNHGEDAVCESFRSCLESDYGYNATAPYSGTAYDLMTGQATTITEGIRIKKEVSAKTKRSNAVFNRLLDAVHRLMRVAENCEGMANKELAKFADQVNQLSDKWSR